MNFKRVEIPGFDEVWRLSDPDGFVALHRARDWPAFGGTRIRRYDSDADALADALRLAEAMTRKYAINELPFGGGKAVLIEQSIRDRRAALRELGDFVESLDGRFLTGSDLGVTPDDVRILAARTRHVETTDGSEAAARSVAWAIRGALASLDGRPSLRGTTIAIQGLGAVGSRLAAVCVDWGAYVVGADVDEGRARCVARQLTIELRASEDILGTPVDVLAPCAVGGVIEPRTVDRLRCRVVCGGANNILDRDETAFLLHERGILYVPDFLSNSGAAIEGACARIGGQGDCTNEIALVGTRTLALVEESVRTGRPPLEGALRRVADRIPEPLERGKQMEEEQP